MRVWRMRTGISITLKTADRRRLTALARDRNTAQKHVWRAEIVLLSAAGVGTNEIMRRTGTSKTCVWRWQERFMQEGYDGLLRDKTRRSRISPLAPDITGRVVTLTQTNPPAEATHWTSVMMAKTVGISASSVQRIWRAHGLQPHRVKQFKLLPTRNLSPNCAISSASMSIRPRHDHTVRRSQRPRRHRHRAQHAASPTPGVHPLSQRHRSASVGRKGDPCHRRQLCDPQASEGSRLAAPAPPLDLPLHPDFGILAQRRRGFFRQAHQAAIKARRLLVGRRLT